MIIIGSSLPNIDTTKIVVIERIYPLLFSEIDESKGRSGRIALQVAGDAWLTPKDAVSPPEKTIVLNEHCSLPKFPNLWSHVRIDYNALPGCPPCIRSFR